MARMQSKRERSFTGTAWEVHGLSKAGGKKELIFLGSKANKFDASQAYARMHGESEILKIKRLTK